MSAKVDLAEFLTAYIAEADEQIDIASAKLMTVEAAARKGERDPRAVRDLFRAMHTLKGLSAMVGVEPVVTVAHHVESVLREADRAGGSLAQDAIDVLLRSVRTMERCVRAVHGGQPAPEPPFELIAALASITPTAAVAQSAASVRITLEPALEQKLDAFERDLLVRGAQDGRRALRLEYLPTPARAAQGVTITSVRERVGAMADIVRVLPVSNPPTAEGAAAGIAFVLLLVTSATDEQLAAAAGVEPSSLRVIVEAQGPTPLATVAPTAEEALAKEGVTAAQRTLLRVDARRLDEAMDRLASLLVTRSRLARAIAKLAAAGADTRELTQVAQENARQLRDLRATILQVRMIPVSEVLERLPLMLRSLMRSSGRQVRLEVEAAGAELDKAVAERLFPAIVHLVRNAVDHGIEPPEERTAAGKPAEGVVRIVCSARTNTRLELAVSDDGRGVDGAAVARHAGEPVPETPSGLLELLCRPGLSTRDEATTTSGRGLGMDIAKRTVEELGGEMSLSTGAGRGTTFTLRVPLTVAVVDAFVVECAGERMVVPVSVVDEIIEVEPERLVAPPHAAESGGARPLGLVQLRGEALPLFALAELLGLDGASGAAARKALVVRRAGEPIGFLLHRVSGQQEAVVRPLVDPLVRVPGVSAATDLGDGRPTLVLDLLALVSHGPRRERALPPGRAPALPAARAGGGAA